MEWQLPYYGIVHSSIADAFFYPIQTRVSISCRLEQANQRRKEKSRFNGCLKKGSRKKNLTFAFNNLPIFNEWRISQRLFDHAMGTHKFNTFKCNFSNQSVIEMVLIGPFSWLNRNHCFLKFAIPHILEMGVMFLFWNKNTA